MPVKSKSGTSVPALSKAAKEAARARSLAEKYMMQTYRRPPAVFTHGRGCRVYDADAREYLDFLAGIAVNALGYAHPRVVRAIRREAARATHVSNLFHNPYQGPLAEKLAEWSGLDRVFLTNSGTEAVEGALKLARAHAHSAAAGSGAPRKTRFLALENSFHGRTFGALSITCTAKYREPFEPLVPGAEFVRFNDTSDLESKFDETVCAIVIEPIQGEGGVFEVSQAFWERARALATKHNAALIADEIQCGLGRAGRRFACQKFPSKPDILTVAKPLGGGLPLGAVIASEAFASAFSPGMHGSTFGGGPLVCAAAMEFLRVMEDENLIENIRVRGAEIRSGLEKLATKFDFIREIRGEGLILGVDLRIAGAPVVEEAFRRGLLINCTHDHVIRLLPPFVLRRDDVAKFLRIFDAVLESVAKTGAAKQTLKNAVPASASAGDSGRSRRRTAVAAGSDAARRAALPR